MKRGTIALFFTVAAMLSVAASALASEPPGSPKWEIVVRQDPAPLPDPAPFSVAGHYSFSSKRWSAIATHRFDTLWSDVFGLRGWNVDLLAIAGGNADTALVGGGVQLTVPIHPRVSVGGGLALTKSGVQLGDLFANFDGFGLGATLSVSYSIPFRS